MLTKRTNILFDESLWITLTSRAKAENQSVGKLIRQAVQKVYVEGNQNEQIKQAIDVIRSTRRTHNRIDYKDLINYGRQ